ncbi:hypothetical protein D1159_16540 [Pseudoflavonifractor sp. 524-17]|uniref:hypothetical protein n=1 Tax=Pseudoflavonifractor sp. 524-17 TaxID=2304577 RepID=UPI00137A68D5|nr:hypothetical protein [Pseudoflavonifractor sp. 524-17]NCE66137.1 hypothetical protein [Pseudoflavonifractor sp. 524-17]
MPELLGATNPVPGYDNSAANRNIPVSPSNTQIQNVPDPNRVVGPDGRTEQQDSGMLGDSGQIRYDSNFQTFLQRLRETPNLAESLSRLFMAGEGTVVLSGMSEGIAGEISQALEMLRMDPDQLLEFVSGQFKAGTRFGGALFALLRNAYVKAASDGVRTDILQFLKNYADFSSTKHIEGNLLRNLAGMANAMPASWAEKLRDLAARLENGIAAGDRQGNLALLREEIFPHMAAYVGHTHDMGTPRGLLSLLTLDVARYENGSLEKLLESFHQLNGYGTLKSQLGGIDDQALLKLLRSSEAAQSTPAKQFSDRLAGAASRALRGEGSAEVQQVFQQLVNAMLVNESVYMPLNHFLFPLELDGRMLFSEMWVDPDAEEKEGRREGQRGNTMKFLLKVDVQSLGLFDIVLTSRDKEVDIRIACPDRVTPFSKEIEQSVAQILARNDLTPGSVSVRRMERPVSLTEVFPKIFEGKNSVNVKV